MSKKLREYLRDQIVVFDIDGVLSVYEFGELSHTADVWKEAFVSEHDNPYCGIAPLPALQEFVDSTPSEHVYVCSVADDYQHPRRPHLPRGYQARQARGAHLACRTAPRDARRDCRRHGQDA